MDSNLAFDSSVVVFLLRTPLAQLTGPISVSETRVYEAAHTHSLSLIHPRIPNPAYKVDSFVNHLNVLFPQHSMLRTFHPFPLYQLLASRAMFSSCILIRSVPRVCARVCIDIILRSDCGDVGELNFVVSTRAGLVKVILRQEGEDYTDNLSVMIESERGIVSVLFWREFWCRIFLFSLEFWPELFFLFSHKRAGNKRPLLGSSSSAESSEDANHATSRGHSKRSVDAQRLQ